MIGRCFWCDHEGTTLMKYPQARIRRHRWACDTCAGKLVEAMGMIEKWRDADDELVDGLAELVRKQLAEARHRLATKVFTDHN